MGFSPDLAARRFGGGLSPRFAAPNSVSQMMDTLSGADEMAQAYPITPFSQYANHQQDFLTFRRTMNKAEDGSQAQENAKRALKTRNQDAARWAQADFLAQVSRSLDSPDGFRERLAYFWEDHFTAVRGAQVLQHAGPAYLEDAIRPHITGFLGDMLKAAAKHPRMVLFLNQNASVGENSPFASKGRKKRGLNENLAREILELHTLGVDGHYSQKDVRSLAKVLTGLTATRGGAYVYDPDRAEPGKHVVLGRSYGGRDRSVDDIDEVLEDIALHPDTARHIAWKLIFHFVSETPSQRYVADIAEAYSRSRGDLMATYEALLNHPMTWAQDLTNVKWPQEFVLSAARALGVTPAEVAAMEPKRFRGYFRDGLRLMGQRLWRPNGPDGWEEADSHWITPQALTHRINWAMRTPKRLVDPLPDPRQFVEVALGPSAPEPVRFAAKGAETKAEGVGIILSSPAFQRR